MKVLCRTAEVLDLIEKMQNAIDDNLLYYDKYKADTIVLTKDEIIKLATYVNSPYGVNDPRFSLVQVNTKQYLKFKNLMIEKE